MASIRGVDRRGRARYGVDGFPYIVGLGAAALGTGLPGLVGAFHGGGRLRRLSWAGIVIGTAAAVPAALGLRYVTTGKLTLRDRMLDAVSWRGDEVVADIGSGTGLLGIGAAKRTRETVHCVDLFIAKDLSGNTAERLRTNAELEGVADRIVVHREDVRRTGLPTGSVDIVLSTLCLHNIPTPQGRREAIGEMTRVLRPGGTIVISDLAHVDEEYAPLLRDGGLEVRVSGRIATTFPLQRLLVARS